MEDLTPTGSREMKTFYFVSEAFSGVRFRRITELGRGCGVVMGAAEVFVEDATPLLRFRRMTERGRGCAHSRKLRPRSLNSGAWRSWVGGICSAWTAPGCRSGLRFTEKILINPGRCFNYFIELNISTIAYFSNKFRL